MPPSKSMAHRAVICAGLASLGGLDKGDGYSSRICNVSGSEDIRATLSCMEALGVCCFCRGDVVVIEGKDAWGDEGNRGNGVCSGEGERWAERGDIERGPKELRRVLDCGESGSTLRFLMPLAACWGEPVQFRGRGRLLERPLDPYFEIFAERGVAVTREKSGFTLAGVLEGGGEFCLPGNISSQFVTGLLLALPLLACDSTIVMTSALESVSYVDLTLDVMRDFGVEIQHKSYREFFIQGNQRYRGSDYTVEGDYSQAAFFLVAAALGCDCACGGLREDSRQGDRRIVEILERCGARVDREKDALRVRAGVLTGVTVDISDIPDLVAPLAVLLCFCRGESRIINGGRLRYKESDRLAAVACELRKLGADIEEGADFLLIRGVDGFRGGCVESWGDHRIAMMLAVAAYKSVGPVWLTGSGSVAKSYPDFFEVFGKSPIKAV